MKLLVETTGAFQLQGDHHGEHIPWNRPAVVYQSNFVTARVSTGAVSVLGQVNDQASDAEFANYLKESDGDMELAVASFLDTFSLEPKAEKPTTARRGKAI